MRSRRLLPAAIGVLLAVLLAVPAVWSGSDDDSDDSRRDDLVGTWRIDVNAPILPPFSGLWIFHGNRTMTDQVSFPGNSVGQGVWKKIGRHRYANTFEGFYDEDLDGVYDLRFRVRVTIKIDGDRMRATGTLEYLTIDGTAHVAGPFSDIPIQGTRMKVIRE